MRRVTDVGAGIVMLLLATGGCGAGGSGRPSGGGGRGGAGAGPGGGGGGGGGSGGESGGPGGVAGGGAAGAAIPDAGAGGAAGAAGGCTDLLEPNRYYVNPSAPRSQSGIGTRQCPLTSLDTALDITPASTFTVCTEGTFSATTETGWPKRVPPNVVLDGTFCGNNTVHSTMLVPAGQAGVSLLGNQAMIRGYDIIGLGGGGSTTTVGIVAAPSHSAVDIRDVTVSGFDYGIMAQNPVSLTLSDGGGNVSCTSNGTGLDVSESASVTIQRTQDLQTSVSFSHNTSHGIVVQNASLTVKGGVYAGAGATALSRTIAADANGVDGLAISSGVKVVLDGFEAVNNRAWGIGLDDSGTFSLANSVVTGNTNGLHIVNSADPTAAPNVAMINLGTAASGTGAGNNHIFGNSQAGVCLDAKPSGTMPAKGNIWSADGSKDCTGTPTAKLTHISDCTMPVDVARGSENMTVDGCAFE